MASIFQSLGLEQSDPLKPKTGNVSDRDSTIAHLLVASGYANAPADHLSAAYSAMSDIKPFALKSGNDVTNVSPIRAAESVSIGTQPPLLRSALTANLLSAEPTTIRAQLAPEDLNCRNFTQCDAALPRPNTGQPEVPVLRVIPVVNQTVEGAVSGSVAPKTELPIPGNPRAVATLEPNISNPVRVETQSPAQQRDVALPVVPQNRVNATDTQVQQPISSSELRPVAFNTADTRINATNATNATPRLDAGGSGSPRTDGAGNTVVVNKDLNGNPITPVVAASAQYRNDLTPVPVQTRSVDMAGTLIRSVDTPTGTQLRATDSPPGTQSRATDSPTGTQLRPTDITTGTQLRPADTTTGTQLRPADTTTGTQLRPTDTPTGTQVRPTDTSVATQNRGVETPINSNVRIDVPSGAPLGTPVRYDNQSPGQQLPNRSDVPTMVSGKFDGPTPTATGAPTRLDGYAPTPR